MPYLFETHMHASQASACAIASGADMARAYIKAGYSGIVVTDHFFNGNCAIPRGLPWKERVKRFISGYLDAKAEGDKSGLTVLFGLEYNYDGAEFLTYGLEPDFLFDNPNVDRLHPREYIRLVKACGGFLSQAHPFRERDYIYGIHLYHETEGVEAINESHYYAPDGGEFDRRACEYAADRNKIMTAGSDAHSVDGINGTGTLFDDKINNNADFLNALRKNTHKLILRGSEYKIK